MDLKLWDCGDLSLSHVLFLIFLIFKWALWFKKIKMNVRKKMDIKAGSNWNYWRTIYGWCVRTWRDEDLFDAGVLDSKETVVDCWVENRFDIRVPVSEFGRDDWNTQPINRWRRDGASGNACNDSGWLSQFFCAMAMVALLFFFYPLDKKSII